MRRQPPADRDSVPPRGRRGRPWRLRPRDRRLPAGGEALAADARSPRVRAPTVNQRLLDAFCDALWLEDGLSRNTIASYRGDLEQLSRFLNGKSLLNAGEEN